MEPQNPDSPAVPSAAESHGVHGGENATAPAPQVEQPAPEAQPEPSQQTQSANGLPTLNINDEDAAKLAICLAHALANLTLYEGSVQPDRQSFRLVQDNVAFAIAKDAVTLIRGGEPQHYMLRKLARSLTRSLPLSKDAEEMLTKLTPNSKSMDFGIVINDEDKRAVAEMRFVVKPIPVVLLPG